MKSSPILLENLSLIGAEVRKVSSSVCTCRHVKAMNDFELRASLFSAVKLTLLIINWAVVNNNNFTDTLGVKSFAFY